MVLSDGIGGRVATTIALVLAVGVMLGTSVPVFSVPAVAMQTDRDCSVYESEHDRLLEEMRLLGIEARELGEAQLAAARPFIYSDLPPFEKSARLNEVYASYRPRFEANQAAQRAVVDQMAANQKFLDACRDGTLAPAEPTEESVPPVAGAPEEEEPTEEGVPPVVGAPEAEEPPRPLFRTGVTFIDDGVSSEEAAALAFGAILTANALATARAGLTGRRNAAYEQTRQAELQAISDDVGTANTGLELTEKAIKARAEHETDRFAREMQQAREQNKLRGRELTLKNRTPSLATDATDLTKAPKPKGYAPAVSKSLSVPAENTRGVASAVTKARSTAARILKPFGRIVKPVGYALAALDVYTAYKMDGDRLGPRVIKTAFGGAIAIAGGIALSGAAVAFLPVSGVAAVVVVAGTTIAGSELGGWLGRAAGDTLNASLNHTSGGSR